MIATGLATAAYREAAHPKSSHLSTEFMSNGRNMLRGAGLVLSIVFHPIVTQGADLEKDKAFWASDVKPFLQTYCADCHSGDDAEAEVNFDAYTSTEQLLSQRPRWNQVLGMIEIGAMPPADYDPLPSHEDRERIAAWIDQTINSVDCDVVNDPGRVTMRRLNIVEYDNTLRDLLSIDFKPSAIVGFPSDDVGNGFDNQGDVLTLAPLQLEKYLQAAKLVADRVIVQDAETFREQEVEGEELFAQEVAEREFNFAEGKYDLKVKFEYGGDSSDEVLVNLLFDGKQVEQWQARGKRSTRKTHTLHVSAGRHTVALAFPKDPNTTEKQDYDRRVDVSYFRVVGPEGGTPSLPASHTNLMIAAPSEDLSHVDAAKQIFKPFLLRAFRRQPTDEDLERVVNLVDLAVREGMPFEKGVNFALQSVLVSPHFLFRVEQEAPSSANSDHEALSDYALASRLSYFLWSSMPDDELLQLAGQGKLREPEILAAQAERMLRDEKAAMLVDRFFGQTFGLGSLKDVDPDQEKFPFWNDRLKAAMLEETRLFCREIISQDLPLETLISGDFTFVNPRLADLYGVEFEGQDPVELYKNGPGFPVRRRLNNREGDYTLEDKFVRVSLPEGRKGILTQAAILTLTSNPTSTSPVKRGKWILENIFGDPPPPAPPNVPDFEETQKEHGTLSLRQQLELHRANPSCASCHSVMDPLGLGFENYDAIGRWRDKDGPHAIDAAGKLADGREFSGPIELVEVLEADIRSIARHFATKMLTYGLGRGLEPFDDCTVDEIMTSAKKNDYRFSSFIGAVVNSDPFRKRRKISPQPDSDQTEKIVEKSR